MDGFSSCSGYVSDGPEELDGCQSCIYDEDECDGDCGRLPDQKMMADCVQCHGRAFFSHWNENANAEYYCPDCGEFKSEDEVCYHGAELIVSFPYAGGFTVDICLRCGLRVRWAQTLKKGGTGGTDGR